MTAANLCREAVQSRVHLSDNTVSQRKIVVTETKIPYNSIKAMH